MKHSHTNKPTKSKKKSKQTIRSVRQKNAKTYQNESKVHKNTIVCFVLVNYS